MRYGIGIDLGATRTKAVAVAEDGTPLAERVGPTDDGAHLRWAADTRALIADLERDRGGEAGWIGLCAPGIAARDGRCIIAMPERMQANVGFDWGEFLGRPAPILNDGQAALLGEVWQGAAQGLRDVVMLTLGTGVGGGILADGRLLRGAIGRAGHVGHMTVNADGYPSICGMPGGLDDRIGNATLPHRSGGRFHDTRLLVAAVGAGDPAATNLWHVMVRDLACAVASLINLIDPEVVVIGGGIAGAGTVLFEPLAVELNRVEWRPNGHRVPIRPAILGANAGALGAAYNAMTANGDT
ncbi:MAG: ROK family protein [Alphaproteobacteria bacterium]|nr:ROK family protein [Alphaproteobacteria bacterium]